MKVHLQCVDQISGNVCLGQSGDVVERFGRIIWHESVHGDLFGINVESVCQTLRQIGEDLVSRVLGMYDEIVVERIAKADLDEG